MDADKQYKMDRAGVDEVSEELAGWLRKSGISKENAIRIRFTMEELLLQICEHFDESVTGTLVMRKRFGTPTLRFRYRGESFDPIRQEEGEEDEVIRQMMSRLGLAPEWHYRAGVNELVLKGPAMTIRQEVLLVAAGAAAILFGIIAGLLPDGMRTVLMDYLIGPVSDSFINALNTFVGIMIFLSVVSGICSIGSAADFSRMGKYVILRQILDTFFFAAFGIVILLPFFRLTGGQAASGASQAGTIVEILFSVIPSNPVTPFADGNMLQIIFMAVLTGTGLLILEEKTGKIRDFIFQATELFMEILSIVCRLLPLYIFASLAVFIVGNGFGVFARLWKPIVVVFIVNIIFMAVKIFYTAVKYRVPAGKLLGKIREPSLTGFFTASSTAAYGQMIDSLDRKIGVAPAFYRFALPFINLLAGNTSAVGILAILYYLSEMQGTLISLSWLITAWFMSSVFSMAMPPVSGSFVVCLGAIMTQLGMPGSGLAVAGILGIIFDFISTGSKIGIQLLEIALQADHFKMLDHGKLRK